MGDYWKEKDSALINEASKVHPDSQRMEVLVAEGADVNAVDNHGEENALSEVIQCPYDEEYYGKELPQKDSLAEVVEFFLKHGFDPSRDEGRAGAKCLANLTWSRCLASKVPAMKLLLDAGCRDIPAWDDEHDPDDGLPVSCISGKASYLWCCQDDLEGSNTYEALYEILKAYDSGRPYAGIDRYCAAYGATLRRVWLSKPNDDEPFFDLNEPTSKHKNCFRGSLYFEFSNGWLISRKADSVIFDTEFPHEDMIDVSDCFLPIIGAALVSTEFSKHSVTHGMTFYGQSIIRYKFGNKWQLTTQTNSGEILGSKTIAYYTLEGR